MRGMRRLKLQELLTNRIRNIAEKVIFSPSIVPLIVDRSQHILQRF